MERLWKNVYDNAQEYRRERLTGEFFRHLDTELGEKSAVILLRKKETPVAFALVFLEPSRMDWLYCGLDYSINEEYALYFNLNFELIRLAIERRVKILDMGITTIEAKKVVGGRVVPLYIYMKHRNALMNRVAPGLFQLMTPGDRSRDRKVFKTVGLSK